uniref:Non-structural protein NS1 n=3 Tax=Orbivirus TaxID=10892 RepID=A0A894KS27_9REOV|nr:tubule protein [Yunnan orbivirus]UBT83499.1 NS1 [Middle Point orbivirus]UBT83528.1 NS1 [Middle Point orbivirus]UBT83538.1 NS1 [Middle Point orbivirus]UBT83548.1 NS1 [Middle Point orbivirus]
MDHFIRYFKLSTQDALHVRLSATISVSWKCSHRHRDCFVYDKCVKENFQEVALRVLHKQDYKSAQKVLHNAYSMMQVRGDLWCNALNYSKNQTFENFSTEKEETLQQLEDAFSHSQFQETVMTLVRNNEPATPVYVDDSQSLIHTFYMPMSTEFPTEVDTIARLGRFLIVFYKMNSTKTMAVWQQSNQAKQFVHETLLWGRTHLPECDFTKSKRTASWIVWFPETAKCLLNDLKVKGQLLRLLDMDLKTIQSFEGRDPTRICYQRFGIRGTSVSSLTSFLLTPIGGFTILELMLNRSIDKLEKLTLPMLLIRGYLFGYYTPNEVQGWYTSNYICQPCYIQQVCRNKHLFILDTRSMDYLGRAPERAARLIKHHDGNITLISSVELSHGEVLSRQQNHWIAYACFDSADALLVTITLIHKFLRGEGVTNDFDLQIAMNCLARCYLYWGPVDNEVVSAIFHLMCYLLLKKKIFGMDHTTPWYDLGTFMDLIQKTENLNPTLMEKMHAAVARVSLFYLRQAIHKNKIEIVDPVHAIAKNIKRFSLSPPSNASAAPRRTVRRCFKTVNL